MKTHLKKIQCAIRIFIVIIIVTVMVCIIAIPILFYKGVEIGSAGVLLTGLAIFLAALTAVSKLIDDHVINSFESAKQLLDIIKDILVPIQNNSLQWIYAARVVLQYQDLKDQVVTPSKLKHLQIHEIATRYEIVEVFSNEGKNGIEPAFFYGVTDWDEASTLDDVAKRSSANSTVVGWVDPDKNQQQPSLLGIPAKAIVAVYDFLEFREEEIELLDNVEVWNNDYTANFPNFKQGAHKYIIHARDTVVIGGKLFRRDEETGKLKEVLKD